MCGFYYSFYIFCRKCTLLVPVLGLSVLTSYPWNVKGQASGVDGRAGGQLWAAPTPSTQEDRPVLTVPVGPAA